MSVRKDYPRRGFEIVSAEKLDSLGETMKLKELLDCWWNSVRIEENGKTMSFWKNSYEEDPEYTICQDCEQTEAPKEYLERLVEVDDEWHFDLDGYPVVNATFVEEVKNNG